MKIKDILLKAARLTEKCARDEISAADAIRLWPSDYPEEYKELDYTEHSLHHFLSDEDIRQRDPGYGELTRNELLKRAALHREEAEKLS